MIAKFDDKPLSVLIEADRAGSGCLLLRLVDDGHGNRGPVVRLASPQAADAPHLAWCRAGEGRGALGRSGARWASELRGRASAYGCRVAHRACRPTPARRNILHPHRYLLIWSVALFRAPPPGLETPYQPGAAPHHAALLRPQVKCGGVAGAREAAEVETESGRCDSCAAYKDSVV